MLRWLRGLMCNHTWVTVQFDCWGLVRSYKKENCLRMNEDAIIGHMMWNGVDLHDKVCLKCKRIKLAEPELLSALDRLLSDQIKSDYELNKAKDILRANSFQNS